VIGWFLLGLFVAVVVALAFYTWLDRFMAPLEQWNGFAYLSGLILGLLAGSAVVFIAAGW
jgi:hypothetical protein